MKKWWIVLVLPLMLSGCAAAEVMETLSDELVQPVMAQAGNNWRRRWHRSEKSAVS